MDYMYKSIGQKTLKKQVDVENAIIAGAFHKLPLRTH